MVRMLHALIRSFALQLSHPLQAQSFLKRTCHLGDLAV
jgi:hypothetical protein